LRRAIAETIKKLKKSVATEKLAALLTSEDFGLDDIVESSRSVFTHDQLYRLLPKSTGYGFFYHGIQKESHLISHISELEINGYMQNVLLRDTDQMSMAHALEVRVPFLDHHLVEYVLSLPDKYKYPHTPKKLLTDSCEGLLPDSVIHRKKMGFTLPWQVWLQGELRPFCERHITSLSERSFINGEEVINLWKRFLYKDPQVQWSRIWHLIVLENWLTKNNIVE
jgi:asparagine synthase (glutamine-hydrolysing)